LRAKIFKYIFSEFIFQSDLFGFEHIPLNKIDSKLVELVINTHIEGFKYLTSNTRSLVYQNDYDENLIIFIPQLFTNLSSLHLFEAKFTLTKFQIIMNELTNLKSLSIYYCLLIVLGSHDNQPYLQLPSSLISFKVKSGALMQQRFDAMLNLRSYLECCNLNDLQPMNFRVALENLKKLKILVIDQIGEGFIETQNSLLFASNQLEYFSTHVSLINRAMFINLYRIRSLTLTMDNIDEFPIGISEINIPTLQNLKELIIKGRFNSESYDELIFSGIQKLLYIGKNVEKLTMPYIELYRVLIENTIHDFSNLKDLSLYNTISDKTLSPTNFPKSLKTLNLYSFNPKTLDIINVRNCDGLKFISIFYSEYFDFIVDLEDSRLAKETQGWRVISFPRSSIRYYKD
jgi:hypothetical protein